MTIFYPMYGILSIDGIPKRVLHISNESNEKYIFTSFGTFKKIKETWEWINNSILNCKFILDISEKGYKSFNGKKPNLYFYKIGNNHA